MEIKDKIFFITGAAGNIGFNIASTLALHNNKIIFTGHDKEKLINTKYQLDKLNNGNNRGVLLDLSNIDAIKHIFKNILKEYGRIDYFIHCAGLSPLRPVSLINYNSYVNIFNINYFSFIEIAKLYSQQKFSEESLGGIIAISSIITELLENGRLEYAVTKSALETSIKVMAKEFINKNIRVNIIRPAMVNTTMAYDYLETIGMNGKEKDIQPYGFIQPKDITDMVMYLLSDKGSKITGSIFDINGGLV